MSRFQTNAAGGNDINDDNGGDDIPSSQGRQSNINNTSGIDEDYSYGDTLDLNRDIHDDSVLCLGLNVNSLQAERWKAKNDRIRNFFKNYEFDIMGMGFMKLKFNWSQNLPLGGNLTPIYATR